MPGVDVGYLAIDLRLNRLIALEPRTRGHTNLHEREPAAQLRPRSQDPIERCEPFGNSLRIVQSIDAQPDDGPVQGQPKHLDQSLLLAGESRIAGNALYPVVIHADGHRD